jgi:hypothetical protein
MDLYRECRSCVNRRFGERYRSHLLKLHADFSTVKMVAIRSSEMSVHTRSTRRHIPEDGILYSHRRENLKSYMDLYIHFPIHLHGVVLN